MTTMRWTRLAVVGTAMCVAPMVPFAQEAKPPRVPAPPKTAYYIEASVLDAADLVPAPPPVGSPMQVADLAELHRIEATRTPAQVAAAQSDETQEDIFSYANVMGPGFTAAALPGVAELSAHVKNEQSVVGAAAKLVFKRPRPYQTDATLHPVCAVTEVPNAYPSGHALTGYLEAFTLAELVPERRAAILARADDYAHNRLVCGVHHPSDIEASRRIAYVTFGYMLATPRFQRDLAAARVELKASLR
jgi:acid phosphatase (class A)